MAGNLDETREKKDNMGDLSEFDLDSELEDLTSFLEEMGIELDETETAEENTPEAGDEITGSISFDFENDGDIFSDDILQNLLFGQAQTGTQTGYEESGPEKTAFGESGRAETDAGANSPGVKNEDIEIPEIPGDQAEADFEGSPFAATSVEFEIPGDRNDQAEPDFGGSPFAATSVGFEISENQDSPDEFEESEIPEKTDGRENRADIRDVAGAYEHEESEIRGALENAGSGEDEKNIDPKKLKKIEKEVDRTLRKTFGRPFSWKRELISWVAMFAFAFLLAFVIDNYLIVNATVPTGSMQNTIMAGDRMIGWRLSYVFSEPERGDIIIFEYPDNPEEIYVKRVIGLPGETVTITDGKIYINDSTEPLEEDYLPEEWVWKNSGYTFVVPEDSYLCLGDNRNNSHDARSWTNTYVTKDAILGQAILCYWPMEDFGWLN
ncbi:MAG: signal peptidase I [Lachnospiraceae bacterium]|nr:signal peptidase I [Lachnospiraceae bacterium]